MTLKQLRESVATHLIQTVQRQERVLQPDDAQYKIHICDFFEKKDGDDTFFLADELQSVRGEKKARGKKLVLFELLLNSMRIGLDLVCMVVIWRCMFLRVCTMCNSTFTLGNILMGRIINRK